MAAPILLKPPYHRRPIPTTYDGGFFGLELANVARAIPSLSIITVTKDYTPTSNDRTILCDTTGGALSILLPKADQAQGLFLTIKKVNAGGGSVTLVGTLDAATNPTLTAQYSARTIQSSGVQYFILASV